MINSITELFQKVLTEAKTQAADGIPHLPHLVEKAIHGRPEEVVRHLTDMSNWVQNKPTEGNMSLKIDGVAATKGGKDANGAYAMYKGSGERNVPLRSEEEIHAWTTTHNKPFLKEPLTLTLKAASHPNLEHGTKFQADVLLHNTPTQFKGNVISYMKPQSRLAHLTKGSRGAVAIHSLIKDGETIPAPDMSHLSTDEVTVPRISMDHVRRNATPKELQRLDHHISQIQTIFSDPEVARVTKAIARHRDPKNQKGHRHVFFTEYNNAFQRGEYGGKRSLDSLMHHAVRKLTNTDSKAEKDRILGHMKFMGTRKGLSFNSLAIHKMLEGHDHIDAAGHLITSIAYRTNPDIKPVDPKTGDVDYTMGEGIVHTISGLNPIKIVPREFTMRNVAESGARKSKLKPKQDIRENEGGGMMTASSGAISGMGYNLGGPAPDDVAVAPRSNRKPNPLRKKLVRKFLDSANLGRKEDIS
jgi:hypothetical protein